MGNSPEIMTQKPERIVREKERKSRTGLFRSQTRRLEREDLFPRRRKIGRNAVGWLESELDSWIASRAVGLK